MRTSQRGLRASSHVNLRGFYSMKVSVVCNFLVGIALLFCSLFPASELFAPAAADVVMVLPFENTSNRPEYNWVGESFADSLADLLNKPGLLVVSSAERELAD